MSDESGKIVRGEEKKRNVPPALKFEESQAVGEKSPAPASVYDLFKKYRKPDEKEEKDDKMNVGFDQLSQDEKSGFLRKLQMLTVGNSKKTPKNESSPSSAGRLLRKFVPSRKSDTSESSSRFFGRKTHQGDSNPGENRKKPARRLNFGGKEGESSEKMVEAMTREYEKIVTLKGVPIKNSNHHYRGNRGCGSLETPTDSPSKSHKSTSISSSSPDSDEISPMKHQRRNQKNSENASWHGELPPRDYTSPTFSRKIFVGGVPWDITEGALKDSFGEFGTCAVEWPGQEARYRSGQSAAVSSNPNLRNQSKFAGQAATGYVYMIFEDERAVAALLHECSQEIGGAGEWYFKIRAQRSKSTEIRQVQIIPWVTSDSLHCDDESILETGIEPKRTVFVGALHGMMTAQVLHSIMEECFGSVECVQLDTDKFKYPIGSGRVTFREHNAYFRAIEVGYLHVQTSKFRKRVQIDPFLESTNCMVCNSEPAHCFCRNRDCFKYYCHSCWSVDHGKDNSEELHIPVIVPSSASKTYSGPPRRPQSSTSSPYKNQQNSPMAHMFPPGGFPIIVGAPPPALSALYGYMQNTQRMMLSPAHFDTPAETPSPSEPSKSSAYYRNSGVTAAQPTVFFNQTPVMSPQKNMPSTSDSYYANTAAFLTPPPTFYAPHSTSSAVSSPQKCLYYGYMPQMYPAPQ